MSQQQLETLVSRLESAVSKLEHLKFTGASSSSSSGDSGSSEAPSVSAFKEYVSTNVQPLVDTCTNIGGECVKGVSLLFGFCNINNN